MLNSSSHYLSTAHPLSSSLADSVSFSCSIFLSEVNGVSEWKKGQKNSLRGVPRYIPTLLKNPTVLSWEPVILVLIIKTGSKLILPSFFFIKKSNLTFIPIKHNVNDTHHMTCYLHIYMVHIKAQSAPLLCGVVAGRFIKNIFFLN